MYDISLIYVAFVFVLLMFDVYFEKKQSKVVQDLLFLFLVLSTHQAMVIVQVDPASSIQ